MAAITIPFKDAGSSADLFDKISAAYCWGESPVAWVNAEAIAEVIGVEKTRSTLTSIGIEIRKFNVKTRRSNGGRFIAVPRVKI